MSSKLVEVKLMLRDMVKYDTLGHNIHVFTAKNLWQFERLSQYYGIGDLDNAVFWF